MNHSRLIARFALGLSFSIVAVAAASCGDSKSAGNPPAGAGNGNTNGSMTNNPLQPGNDSGGTGNTPPRAEGNPVVVTLDPDRDPTVPVNLIESGAVGCGGGGDFCVAPNLTCCTVGGGGMATFSCAPAADDCPDGTLTTASCSSSISCAADQVCCRTGNAGGGAPGGGNASTTCEASCDAGSAQLCLDDAECGDGGVCNNGVCGAPACTAVSCGDGELCCRGQGGGQAAQPACIAAADQQCPAGRRQVCDDDTQCPAGNTCAPIGGGGGGAGATVCTPPPCSPTSCATGQVCCVGGGIGTPTCSTAAATGACPGNSRLVCITDAECTPTPGTQCLLAQNGGGSLSCRVPPAPPVTTDAGADGG